MSTILVRDLDVMADADWSFRDSQPRWSHRLHVALATFDPFPGYPHQADDVRAAAAHVEAMCPPTWDVELYVADREEVGRSNGFSTYHAGGHYENGEWVQGSPTGLIMLSGKRIPPHPAVTRYLVAHEYGHNVEWMLQVARGAQIHGSEVMAEYGALRGLSAHHGSGGRWHDSAHEVFACDFRILVCGVEPEFWPHPGVPRPEAAGVPVEAWWAEAAEQLRGAREAAA